MIIISACLVGVNCKYSGGNNDNEKVKEFLKDKEFIIICPEQLGGLATPRNPSEINYIDGSEVLNGNSKVITWENIDVTDNFVNGAKESLKIAQMYNCKQALLKESSPSCGCNFIYDGSFTGNKVCGMGVTAALFKENNIEVFSEKEL
ncbi:MAG: DUF523 domain-containing protein [Terrisporobacter sp.]|uniref:DUF523 domain-containing protein n=1 Tax=Terrisporobacter sp. TaxID=1965305 RepID=UPI002FCCB859